MDFSYLDLWTDEETAKEDQVGEGYRHVAVLVEASAGALLPAAVEALGQARDLADNIGVNVYGVLLGTQAGPLAEELIAYGADKVLVAAAPELDEYQPEVYAQALAGLVAQYRPEILLIPGTPLGDDLAPRLAQRLGTGLLSNCVKLEIDLSERLLVGTYPILNGDVYNSAICPAGRPQIATLQPGSFRVPYRDGHRSGDVQQVDVDLSGIEGRLVWTDLNAQVEMPAIPLRNARVVVSAGRGMGDAEGFKLVEQLAEALGGAVAGSRGALDEGWIGENQVVGIGGETVAPDLYVACGLSGDIYHYAGAHNARFIVAINADEGAPIMKVANLAVIGDARRIIPAMLQALGK